MVDRRLILSREGLPLCWALMAGEIRRRILECRDEDAELLQVFSVPSSSVMSIGERFTLDYPPIRTANKSQAYVYVARIQFEVKELLQA